MRMQTGPTSTTGSDRPWAEGTAALHALIQPSRVAVIGAFPAAQSLRQHANRRPAAVRLYRSDLPGEAAVPRGPGDAVLSPVADLPGVPDLALAVLRQALTVDIVKECAEAGVRAAIVVALAWRPRAPTVSLCETP